MTWRVEYQYDKGVFAEVWADVKKPMADAATAAMRQATELAKAGGRASIASAGFSAKWQNALRGKVYPSTKASLSPAGLIYHKISYSEIFETGGTISGKPLLWLPIDANLPLKSGGSKWTPKEFIAKVGPLRRFNRPGRPPLLIASIAVGLTGGVLAHSGGRRPKRGRVINARIRQLPVFVGIPVVSIGKKFNVEAAVRGAAAKLPELYDANLKTD